LRGVAGGAFDKAFQRCLFPVELLLEFRFPENIGLEVNLCRRLAGND